MKIRTTKINDCYLVTGDRFCDHRGFFQQLYSKSQPFDCLDVDWKQVNYSHSSAVHVLRGIHWAPYRKFVTCVHGTIYDVVIDLRPESTTYLKWDSFWLTQYVEEQVLVPAGCGHAFYVQEPCVVIYLQEEPYRPGLEKDWHWQSLGVEWPEADEYILSDKDKIATPYQPYTGIEGQQIP